MAETIPVQPEDEPLLFDLYASTRRDELAAWGWGAAQQNAFLKMQFDMQRRAYQMQYPGADHRIILSGGEKAGRILTFRTEDAFHLVDIALLPPYRNAGIGGALIRELQAKAAADGGKPVKLHVLMGSPAQRLYERLGFEVTAERAPYLAMEWRPGSDQSP